MKCCFGGLCRESEYVSVGKGVCSFLILDLGVLHRTVSMEKDELVLDFTSLLLLLEFILLNPYLFKHFYSLEVYGSNNDVLKYLKQNKVPAKIRSLKEMVMSFIKQNPYVKVSFLKISKETNPIFFKVASLPIDMKMSEYVKSLMEVISDPNKNQE